MKENDRANFLILVTAALAAVAFVATVWSGPAPRLRWQPISPPAAAAIATCGGPIYNTYTAGGILIWFVPGQPVFIDNRQDPYPLDLLKDNRLAEGTGRYEELFDRYQVRCAIMEPESSIAARLRSDAEWSVRHADRGWVVFARR